MLITSFDRKNIQTHIYMASGLGLESEVCGFVGLDDGSGGFFYCQHCGSQAQGIKDTASWVSVKHAEFFDKYKVCELTALLTSDVGSFKNIVSENISRDRGFRALTESSNSSLSKSERSNESVARLKRYMLPTMINNVILLAFM